MLFSEHPSSCLAATKRSLKKIAGFLGGGYRRISRGPLFFFQRGSVSPARVTPLLLAVTRFFFFFFFLKSSGGWGRKIKLKLTTLPRIVIHVVRRFDSITFAIRNTSWRVLRFPLHSDSVSCLYLRSPLTTPAASYTVLQYYSCVRMREYVRHSRY